MLESCEIGGESQRRRHIWRRRPSLRVEGPSPGSGPPTRREPNPQILKWPTLGRLAGGTKPEVERVRRGAEAIDREDAGTRVADPVAAAKQRAGTCQRGRPGQAVVVTRAEQVQVGDTGRAQRRPVRSGPARGRLLLQLPQARFFVASLLSPVRTRSAPRLAVWGSAVEPSSAVSSRLMPRAARLATARRRLPFFTRKQLTRSSPLVNTSFDVVGNGRMEHGTDIASLACSLFDGYG